MDKEILKKLTNEYGEINSLITDIENEVAPFEETFSNVNFAYEQNKKKDIDLKFKNILVKTKKVNNTIKEYENKINKQVENIKKIFYPRIKILKQKYASLLKNIVSINDKYNSYTKNANKFASLRNEELLEMETKFTYNDGDEDIDKKDFTNLSNYNSVKSSISTDHVVVKVDKNANEQVLNTYRDIAYRNEEVEQLARDVQEILSMFQDFAVLINAQHEEIILIENTVEEAQTKTESGNKKLVDSIILQRKARKKTCCIMCVSIIVIVIFASIAGILSSRFA
jgi:t-SNARE complex subunit (syntaxin)